MVEKRLVPAALTQMREAGYSPAQQRAAGLNVGSPYGDKTFIQPVMIPVSERSGVASLQDTFEEKRDVYRGILGDPAAQREGAQADALFAIANFGLQLAGATGGRVGATFGEKLAQAAEGSKVLPTISGVAKNYRDANQKFDLAALQSAESERTAAQKAEADRLAAARKAKAKRMEKEEDRAFDLQKLRITTAADPTYFSAKTDGGYTVRMVTRQALNADDSVTSTTKPMLSEGKLVVTDMPTGVETQQIMNANGDVVLLQRLKGVPGATWQQSMVNGKPMVVSRPGFELKEIPDVNGGKRVLLVDKFTQQPIQGGTDYNVPADRKTLTVQDNGSDVVLSLDPKGEGDPTVLWTGKPDSKLLTIDGNVVAIDRGADGKWGTANSIYTSPGKPALKTDASGRLGYAYPPSEGSPRGMWIPLHGPQPKAQKYDYATFADAAKGQTYTLYRVDDGKNWHYTDTDEVVGPFALSQMVEVSSDTAYGAQVDAKSLRAAKEVYVRDLVVNFGDQISEAGFEPRKFINKALQPALSANPNNQSTANPLSRAEAAAYMAEQYEGKNGIAELARSIGDGSITAGLYGNINFAEMVQQSTGLAANLRNAVATAGSAVFGAEWWASTVEARQFVRLVSLDMRLALANSPRVAEGEQTRLKTVLPDVERWLTSGTIEAGKLRGIKTAFKTELTDIRKRLAGEGGRGVPTGTYKTTLLQSEARITNTLSLLTSVVPLGAERERAPAVQTLIDSAKDVEKGLPQ